MTLGAWFSRNLDHGGTGGGTQDAMALKLASLRCLGLKELIQAGAPLERKVVKGPSRPSVQSHCHQQETQVKLPSFFS